jgi:thiol-disulfide isomerase/thioredoxin
MKFFGLVLACALSVGCAASSTPSALVGKSAPATRVQLLDGDYLPLEAFRGKNVVLVFWAQWCAKSKQLLEKIHSYQSSREPNPDLVYLMVSIDKEEDLPKLRQRIASSNWQHFTHAFSGAAEYDEAYRGFSCSELPQVFVLNKAGLVVANGAQFEAVELGLKALKTAD